MACLCYIIVVRMLETWSDQVKSGNNNIVSIDEYIAGFSPEIQAVLQAIRRVIRDAAPEAVEKISYQMPTFWLHGNLVHFAAHKKHLGFYPTPSGISAFEEQLANYTTSKGAVHFPYDKSLPGDLIADIVRFRVVENIQKAETVKRRR